MAKLKVISTTVQLHAFSIPGVALATFSKATLKTVYGRWKRKVARYVVYDELVLDSNGMPACDKYGHVIYRKGWVWVK